MARRAPIAAAALLALSAACKPPDAPVPAHLQSVKVLVIAGATAGTGSFIFSGCPGSSESIAEQTRTQFTKRGITVVTSADDGPDAIVRTSLAGNDVTATVVAGGAQLGSVAANGCGGEELADKLIDSPWLAKAAKLSAKTKQSNPQVAAVTPPSAEPPQAPAPSFAWPSLRPSQAGGVRPNDAAVILAVERYAFLPKVPGATRNADDWHRFFTEGGKLSAERVLLRKDVDVTSEDMRSAVEKAASRVGPDGKLWIVFIGHGAPSDGGKDGVLLGVDTQQRTESLVSRGVRQSELLQKAAGKPVVAILDACFSGRAPDGAPLVPGVQPVLAVHAQVPSAATVLSAARGDQFAGALPGESRPAFSYLVLGALTGWGDANGDGVVTSEEAVAYASKALDATLRGRAQSPEHAGPALSLGKGGAENGPDLAQASRALSGK